MRFWGKFEEPSEKHLRSFGKYTEEFFGKRIVTVGIFDIKFEKILNKF